MDEKWLVGQKKTAHDGDFTNINGRKMLDFQGIFPIWTIDVWMFIHPWYCIGKLDASIIS
jgi:hypothetical protein